MKKTLLLTAVAALLLVVPLANARPSECIALEDVYCDTECDTLGGWFGCYNLSTRCCFDGPSTCGDMHHEDCGPFCDCSGEGGF